MGMTAHKIHFMSKQQRSHFREHYYETHDNLCFKLETFGIPIERAIFLPNGRLGLSWYREWMKCLESREKEVEERTEKANSGRKGNDVGGEGASAVATAGSDIILPRKFDVLFGKGKSREHVGNLRCAYLVEQHQAEYERANRSGKTQIAENIIAMVNESGGRFLKKDGNKCWREVTHTQAREKVSHFFRRLREVQKTESSSSRQQQQQQQHHEKRGLP